MNVFMKAAISLAATSVVLAPVVASAAPVAAASFEDVRAISNAEGSELEGSTGWIVALLALAAIVGGILIATGNNDDNPTSP